MGTTKFVLFKDCFEENSTENYGILLEDGYLVCLCCGGTFEPGDYKIVKTFDDNVWRYVNETLKAHFN